MAIGVALGIFKIFSLFKWVFEDKMGKLIGLVLFHYILLKYYLS